MSEHIWLATGEATVLAAEGQYTDAMPEVIIGDVKGPVGHAFASMSGQVAGHPRMFVIRDLNQQVRPATMMTTKMTVKSEAYVELLGGVLQAASWALYEEVKYDRDGITSRDWDSYPILRFDNVPEVETILMERPGMPFLGAGEASSGPAGGAIANAIKDATGLRLRRMPFNPDALRKAAMDP